MPPASPLACLAAALLIAMCAGQPAVSQTTPDAMVQALLDEQRQGDWAAVAERLDPQTVHELAEVTRGLRDAVAQHGDLWASDGTASDPALASLMSRRLSAAVPLGESDTETVGRVLAAEDARSSRLAAIRADPAPRVIGSVLEGDSLGHVVVALAGLESPATTAELITVHRNGVQWVLRLDSRFDVSATEFLRFAVHNWLEVVGHIAYAAPSQAEIESYDESMDDSGDDE